MAEPSQSTTSTPMRSAQDSIGVPDASLSALKSKSSPHVLGLKLGCTFSRGVAPKHSLGILRRKTDDVVNIDFQKIAQKETGKMSMVHLEKLDERIEREINEDQSAMEEIQNEEGNEVSKKFKSSSDEEGSLSSNDLENTQNTSRESATTSSAKDGGTDKCGTIKSSSSSSEEGDSAKSDNNDSEDNGDGNDDSEDNEDGGYDEDEDEYNESVESQSTEINVSEHADETPKVNLQKKEVQSPKSIASRIKEYSRRIGDKGVKYTISGPLPNYDMLPQLPKSDLKGFLSPKAKEAGFIPIPWNQGMVKSTSSEVPRVIGEADGNTGKATNIKEEMSTDDIQEPSIPSDDLALLDPSNVGTLPENIFHENQPPATLTPKTSKENNQQQCNPSTDDTSDITKESKPQNDGAANGSSTDGYDETTKDKTHDLSGADETNKLPKKFQITDLKKY